jgi:CxxC-x17-CxxC domain-containing protein
MIVFGRTKHGVKKLARRLSEEGYPVAALQGNLSQNARDAVMDDFRAGRVRVLLATNVAARGLDITSVDTVVNFELPESPELLTHRVGRTGRMGREGRALTLLAPEDGAKWRQLERGLGRQVMRRSWAGARAALIGAAETGERIVTPARPARPLPPSSRSAALPSVETKPPRRPRLAERRPSPPSERVAVHPGGGGDSARASRPTPADRPRSRDAERVADEWGDAMGDRGAPANPTLLARHGRDPRRPVWADGRGAATAPAPERSRPRAARSGPHGEEHGIVCTACGGSAHVRFRPDPTRPVFCDPCFRARHDRIGGARAGAR